ncbi:endolytic transglycosylase MltG [Robertkochia solimangrovi]|uniref:endolytic transglycosylase MltG n=1 Tax=Robertkochia solimangrovi TaxID=2213046 RepID=UPI00117C8BDA|nr:endolytic transglycosylase MltG [Robertkochia solimangrovi]TRZ41056.1 endolytic transglycosylase MltG [Robertkochia solimangrovi]
MYIKKILVAIALIGVVVGGIIVYNIYNAIFAPNTVFEEDRVFIEVPTNAGFSAVKAQLQPLLKDMSSFERVAQRKGYIGNIKAGRFPISKGMNNNEIVNSIRSRNIPLSLSFNNQESLGELAGRISDQIEADSVSLLKVFNDKEFLDSINMNSDNAIGMYIPNTYEFFWNTDAEAFRDRMYKEYNKFWNETRIGKAMQLGLTPKQVTALAAIVQKESAKVDERPRIAGVYINRIRKKMPLQADPTVIFAKKKLSGDFEQVIKRVLNADLQLDSPYNTYKYAGIPPGPICMPDISSIDAVLNFEQHDYLYFVADTKNFGYHKFAKTLSQHNVNAKEYHQWINAQGIRR